VYGPDVEPWAVLGDMYLQCPGEKLQHGEGMLKLVLGGGRDVYWITKMDLVDWNTAHHLHHKQNTK
jgi:hypothetical protein